MRLDHLLSTENTVRCFLDSVCPERVEWFHVSFGDAGVEEIVVLDARRVSGSCADMLLGSRTATPQSWIVARFDAHAEWPVVLGMVGGTCGAWWFENWIVDASKRNVIVSFCLSRFRQTLYCFEFGFEIDRFVIIFSVMICRLAILLSGNLRAGQWFLLLCRLQGRMVDALADSTDEGRLRMR